MVPVHMPVEAVVSCTETVDAQTSAARNFEWLLKSVRLNTSKHHSSSPETCPHQIAMEMAISR